MEEEIDIYADLTIFNEKNVDKCKKCVELETQLDDLMKKVENLQKSNKVLEVNISSLLLTAKGEVSRKDRMIADLRRQLDDKSFRRGKFKYDEKYRFHSDVSESTPANGLGPNVIFNSNVTPPILLRSVQTFATPSLYKECKIHISALAPSETSNIKNEISHQVTETSEYNFNSEFDIDEEGYTKEKYVQPNAVNTIFSQRLRKKLEDEEVERKTWENQDAEKKNEKEENEKVIPNDEGESKDKEKPHPSEETGNSLKLSISENEKECSLKCNIDNKENVSCSNQLQRHSDILVSQLKVSALNDENSIKNRPVLVNKPSIKRPHEDYHENVEVKRTKTETLIRGYDNLREHYDDGGIEPVKNKQESKSLNLNNNRNDNFEKSNEIREEKHCDRRIDKIEDCSHSLLASRLYQLSEQSVPTTQAKRREFDKRQANAKVRSKDRDNLERGRYEIDKYKNKFEKDKHDSERYFENFEKERDHRDKYKDRFESERYERDYYDYKYEKLEKRKYDKNKQGKYDKNNDEMERYERERNKQNYKYNRRSRRSQSLSPVRIKCRQKDVGNNDFKDSFGKLSPKNTRYEYEDLRDKLDRPNEEEGKLDMENFNFKRQREFKGRSKSCSGGRNESGSFKRGSNFQRSRSKGKEYKMSDSNKKISLQNYRARRDHDFCKNASYDIVLKNPKDRIEKELITNTYTRSRTRSRTRSKDKDCKNECSAELKINSRKSRERNIVETDLGKNDTKLPNILEESIHNKELENMKIPESSFTLISGPQFINENNKTQESVAMNISNTLDNFQGNIENIKDTFVKRDKNENLQEEEEEEEVKKMGKKSTNEGKLSIKVDKIEPTNQTVKKTEVIEDSVKKTVAPVSDNVVISNNKSEKTDYTLKPVSEKLICDISDGHNKMIDLNKLVKDQCNTKLNPELIEDTGENFKSNLERHVQSLDSFIESAEKVLEENKEGYRAEQISREVADELKEAMELTFPQDTSKIHKLSKPLKEASSPDKEKKKHKKTEPRGREVETETSSPVKERKRHKRIKSKEREVEKDVLSPLKEKKIKVAERESSFSSQLKENKIVVIEKESSKDKIVKLLEESHSSEVKKKVSPTKVLNLVNAQQQAEIQSNIIMSSHISISVKERRKQMTESQKSTEALSKPKGEVKFKEIKKQTQKSKSEDSDAKPKTKKLDGKLQKKVVVIVKRRTRPVILTDTNASTTIVSKENMIINVKLNTGGDKNLLS